jgi:hypothetical protein
MNYSYRVEDKLNSEIEPSLVYYFLGLVLDEPFILDSKVVYPIVSFVLYDFSCGNCFEVSKYELNNFSVVGLDVSKIINSSDLYFYLESSVIFEYKEQCLTVVEYLLTVSAKDKRGNSLEDRYNKFYFGLDFLGYMIYGVYNIIDNSLDFLYNDYSLITAETVYKGDFTIGFYIKFLYAKDIPAYLLAKDCGELLKFQSAYFWNGEGSGTLVIPNGCKIFYDNSVMLKLKVKCIVFPPTLKQIVNLSVFKHTFLIFEICLSKSIDIDILVFYLINVLINLRKKQEKHFSFIAYHRSLDCSCEQFIADIVSLIPWLESIMKREITVSINELVDKLNEHWFQISIY